MPLNVKRFCASVLFLLFAFILVFPQTAPNQTTDQAPITPEPTAAEVMRARIAKAKSFIVVRNYNAAIYELENIKRESKDTSVYSVINILLMHCYIEQNDYGRAQNFLESFYKDLKSSKPDAATNYYAVAGQVVKAARNQFDRYRSLGLNVADRNLPLEALMDIDKMRETLEAVIGQTKTLGADKKQSSSSLPILEEAINARSNLARDDYDANHWKQEVADAREMLVDSTSKVVNAVDGTTETPTGTPNAISANLPPIKPDTAVSKSPTVIKTAPPEIKPTPTETGNNVTENPAPPKPETTPDTADDANTPTKNNPRQRIIIGANNQEEKNSTAENPPNKDSAPTNNQETPASNEPVSVGSLIGYATKRANPVYPPAARNIRMTGVVKLDVIIDEEGRVAEITKSSGPGMLQRAAEDALKKWEFKPFLRDGQPVKAIGFISFNFNL